MEMLNTNVSNAYNVLGYGGKILYIIFFVVFFIVVGIPDQITYILGLRSNKKQFNLKRITTSPVVFVGEYAMPTAYSNCVVIKGKDGKLLIRSPPQPLPHIVARIKEEGDVGVIIVSSAHDTYADKWKELFPSAVVIGPKADIPLLNDRVQVDYAAEDADEILSNYHIVKRMAITSFSRYEDHIYLIQLESGKIVASLSCGFSNVPFSFHNPFHWRYMIPGTGVKINRLYGLVFVKSHANLRAFWQELAQIPGLIGLIFLHGETIMNESLPEILLRSHPGREFQVLG